MTVRFATAEDLYAWYGGPPPMTMRAAVAEVDGRIVAVGGVGRAIDHRQLFFEVADVARPRKLLLGRLAVKVRGMIDGPVIAIQDENEPTAARLIEWAGMSHRGDGVWSN
jgi:hypothetical protein